MSMDCKNILVDYHHESLMSSYLYTLEARLGYNIYRCIGTEWFKHGYWRINRQRDTIQQYLGTYGYQPEDGTPSLNQIQWVKDDIYYSKSPNTGQIHKAITFEKFMHMDWLAVISSIPEHIKPFRDLARMKKTYQIFQMGNEFPNVDWSKVDNLMASVAPRDFGKHSVFYHQEFDLNVFNYEKPGDVEIGLYTKGEDHSFIKDDRSNEIHNYMNVLHNYPEAHKYFLELEKEMPDYTFKMYGSQNRDGCITGVQNLADSMRKARWIFHNKPGGDGYGHVVHNAYAVGRPLIVNKRHYEGKLGGQLMNDDNCIVMDSYTPRQLSDIIRKKEANYNDMSKASRFRFDELVDFEKEAKLIQKFLEELV